MPGNPFSPVAPGGPIWPVAPVAPIITARNVLIYTQPFKIYIYMCMTCPAFVRNKDLIWFENRETLNMISL